MSVADGGRPIRHPVAAVDRRHAIVTRVAEDQTIHVGELARELAVSEMTIRRDIRRLERDGFVRQTYGGATAHLTRSLDLAFNSRALQHAREKRLIGMRAIGLVADARVVFVGIGTTAEQFARYLPGRAELTVVTASIPISSLLGTRPVRVVATGGDVQHDELSCVGSVAIGSIGRYRFDAAVIGTAGLSARWGISELTDADADVVRAALDRSDRVIVIADGSKIGASAPAIVASATRVSTLVTDASARPDELAALRDLGVEIVIATDSASAPAGARSSARRDDATTDALPPPSPQSRGAATVTAPAGVSPSPAHVSAGSRR